MSAVVSLITVTILAVAACVIKELWEGIVTMTIIVYVYRYELQQGSLLGGLLGVYSLI